MNLAGKELTLAYNMKAIKAVQQHFGIESFSGIPVFLKAVSEDYIKMADFCVACIFYGCDVFSSIDEIESNIEKAEDIAPAASEFLSAFNKFYGIKGEGEVEAPLTGSN